MKAQFEQLVDEQVSLEGLDLLFSRFAAGDRIKPQLHLQQ